MRNSFGKSARIVNGDLTAMRWQAIYRCAVDTDAIMVCAQDSPVSGQNLFLVQAPRDAAI
jgi:hypothetical protein